MTLTPNKEKPRLLIIDDDESIRDMLTLMLDDEGFNVDTAKDGKEAITKSYSKIYNLAIVDWRLPDIDGTNLLPLLKSTTPRMAKIMLTGFPSAKNVMDASKNGADAFLVKPVEPPILLKKIEELLRKQKETRKTSEEISEFTVTKARELLEEKSFMNTGI